MIKCNLGVLLAERKMTIQDLADRTKLSRTTISALVNESGKGIQFDTMEVLCNELKIVPGQLFSYIHFSTEFSFETLTTSDNGTPHEVEVQTRIERGDAYFTGNFVLRLQIEFDESNTITGFGYHLWKNAEKFRVFLNLLDFANRDTVRMILDKSIREFVEKLLGMSIGEEASGLIGI